MQDHGHAPRHAGPRGGWIFAAVLLVLLIGGAAGAAGGYLAAGHRSQAPAAAPEHNSLDSSAPAARASAPPSGSVEDAARRVLPAVVQLQYSSGSASSTGSGVVFGSDGLILTNDHVVAEAKGARIAASWQNGRTKTARLVGRDPTSDLAVLRAEGAHDLPTAPFGRSSELRVGQQVVAIGSPFRLAGTVTTGIVSAKHRATRAGGGHGERATVLDAVQTDAAINPGNSGGPLVNLRGEVVGVDSAIYSPPSSGLGKGGSPRGNLGVGFAIPSDQAKRVGQELARNSHTRQAVLGVTVRDGSGSGAVIAEVRRDGPGQRAGLRSGQVITAVEGRPVRRGDDFVAAVHAAAPGSTLTLTAGSRTVHAKLAGRSVGHK